MKNKMIDKITHKYKKEKSCCSVEEMKVYGKSSYENYSELKKAAKFIVKMKGKETRVVIDEIYKKSYRKTWKNSKKSR